MERALPRRVVLARKHRKNPTLAERQLWALLRRRQLDGLGFRRQFPVGPYFADFFCPAARLAIELDGDSHRARERRDRIRDTFFLRRGIAVLRMPNQLVLEDPAAALELVRVALRACSPLTQ
ncbi:MAG: endonuclease domain-containing protein [Myxococcales bacterium]|nr:endonuclease domain-containing protein [Myxococcales bacterium]